MSEVLALAVEAVNGCLVKFPRVRCEPVPHILLDVVVWGESFASQSLLRDQKWHNFKERGLDCMEDDREPATWISARVLAFSHMTCTCDPLAEGSELPRSCRSHSLLHKQRYVTGCTFQTPACFFLNASRLFLSECPLYKLFQWEAVYHWNSPNHLPISNDNVFSGSECIFQR